MSNGAPGIIGSDGIAPLYTPEAKWEMWSKDQIYLGGVGLNRHIPKVKDYVIEPETGLTWFVTDLDPITFIPELSPIELRPEAGNDELTSRVNDKYRVYYDKSTQPHTLSVDSFFHTYSLTATYARIYRGTEIDPAKIISRKYDNSGNFVGHDVPMSMVRYNSHDNYGVKSIPTCSCTADLVNGEPVSIVVFDSNGKVIRKDNAIIDETTFVAQAYAEQKYITNIFLKSVFIENAQSNIINFPVNLPMSSFNPIGVVQYNDGSQIEYLVDGDKFILDGVNQIISTVIGHRAPMILKYRLDSNESYLGQTTVSGNLATKAYDLIVSQPNRSYNVKFFLYPVWVDELSGYRYVIYLMNLDRDILYDVTNLVSLSNNSPSFVGNAFGVTQRLTFNLDLSSIGGGFNSFVHVQTIDIILRGRANDASQTNIWEVGNTIPSANPYYGGGLRARLNQATRRRVNVGNGFVTANDFIDKVYKPTLPIINPLTETEPLKPTHIEVRSNTKTVFVGIAEYNADHLFDHEIALYSTVDIIFYREVAGRYLKLAIASMTVR